MPKSIYTTDLGLVYNWVSLNHYYVNENPVQAATDLIPWTIQGLWIPGKASCFLPKELKPRFLGIISTEGDDLRVPIPFNSGSPLWSAMLFEVQSNSLIKNAFTIGEKIDPYRVGLLA